MSTFGMRLLLCCEVDLVNVPLNRVAADGLHLLPLQSEG
jgi:hypothetical protein